MKGPKVRVEEVEVTGEKLLATVKELIHQGNVRRIVLRNAKGVTLLEIPLVVGIAGAVLVPVWAAIGALAALVARLTLVIERVQDAPAPPASDDEPAETPVASAKPAARKAPRRKTPPRR
ncbi:MAG: DUF4342 domain-containing protein [Holophagales bacterium]|jgi:hypothetical protein|nr:DUF4342 domain-containing protein [Holophagales bacterium]MBK9964610.1 DUF4342 domain-containing protein [Holophagales bacterium]